MSDVTPLTANLVVVVLESFLYGIYVIMASCALYFMVSRHRERLSGTSWFSRSNLLSPVALGALALFIMVTIHWLLNVARVFIAFHRWEDGPGPVNRVTPVASHDLLTLVGTGNAKDYDVQPPSVQRPASTVDILA
ncbi:hypothetical protein B0H14DRAFT_2602427 [Mycena olivaceomarginata]|nr:hypothetical protein B0H14DRAFT_2602427 [Mycena olivaceomarginata]